MQCHKNKLDVEKRGDVEKIHASSVSRSTLSGAGGRVIDATFYTLHDTSVCKLNIM